MFERYSVKYSIWSCKYVQNSENFSFSCRFIFSEVTYLRILIYILADKLWMTELSHISNNAGGRSREK